MAEQSETARHAPGRAARAVAAETCSDLVELQCVAPAPVCEARIRRRLAAGTDVSEATPEVARRMAGRFATWPEAHPVDTAGSVASGLEDAMAAFAGRAPANIGR